MKIFAVLIAMFIANSTHAQQVQKYVFTTPQFIDAMGENKPVVLLHGKSDKGQSAVMQVTCYGSFSFKELAGRISVNTGVNYVHAQSIYVGHKYPTESACRAILNLIRTASPQSPIVAVVNTASSDIEIKSARRF